VLRCRRCRPAPRPARNGNSGGGNSESSAGRRAEGKFGARGDLNPEKHEQLSEITGKVTEVGAKAHGELVVTLDNGQVWAEKISGSKLKVKVGDTVKIESGALGSFVLIANGRSSKVARVR